MRQTSLTYQSSNDPAQTWVAALLKRLPATAIWCLEEEAQSADWLQELAWNTIRTEPKKALQTADIVGPLSRSMLEKILSDKQIAANELTLFGVLKTWVDKDTTDCSRLDAAKEMVSLIDLKLVPAPDLRNVVKPSGLVTSDQLCEAYEYQAMDAPNERLPLLNRKRNMPPEYWQSSGADVYSCSSFNHVVELLDKSAIIRCGVLQRWSVKVERLCKGFRVGVASTTCLSMTCPLNTNDWLGYQAGSWGYLYNGIAYTAGKYVLPDPPTFGEGAAITMTLDLREGINKGTLEASIDGGPTFRLFRGMLDLFEDEREVGFLPAVSLKSPGKVRFLGMESLL